MWSERKGQVRDTERDSERDTDGRQKHGMVA